MQKRLVWLLGSSCVMALMGAAAVTSAHAQSVSQCGGTQYLSVGNPNDPNTVANPTIATATDPSCQSNNISSAASQTTLNFLQGFSSRSEGTGLWFVGASDSLKMTSATVGKGASHVAGAGADYNFGNQIPFHFGFGVTTFDADGSTGETGTLAGSSYKVKGIGALGYINYTKYPNDQDSLSSELIVNASKLQTRSATSYGSFRGSLSPDGSSLAINATLSYSHRLRDSNSLLVGLIGAGSVANRYDGSELKDRTDTFLYVSGTYSKEVSKALSLYLNLQAQSASNKFQYGANTSLTTLPTYTVAGSGTLRRATIGAYWQATPKWAVNLTASSASAKKFRDNGVLLLVTRKFGN